MHVLLTRPLEDSKDLIFNFKSKGFKVSHLPLLNIQKINYEQIDFNSYEALIFTSSNSIRNLETKNINKETTCFCVGFATERSVKLRGFKNIFAAEGNVNNLKELILQNFTDKQKKILYVSGEIVTQRLDIELKSEGYSVNRLINYKVLHNQNLDLEFLKKLKEDIPKIIYVYSENSAKSFLNLIEKYELVDYWMNTNLMCIGEKTSLVLNEIKWKKIFLFNPGEEEFLLYKI